MCLPQPKPTTTCHGCRSPRLPSSLYWAPNAMLLLNGKYAPDIEDVKAIANNVLRHRIVRNYKAEAENITVEKIIQGLL